jgi:hypothetical protein
MGQCGKEKNSINSRVKMETNTVVMEGEGRWNKLMS